MYYKYRFGFDLSFGKLIDKYVLYEKTGLPLESYDEHEFSEGDVHFDYFYQVEETFSCLNYDYEYYDLLKSFIVDAVKPYFEANVEFFKENPYKLTIKVYYDNNADFSEEELEKAILPYEEFDKFDLDIEIIKLLASINASIEYVSFAIAD